MSKKQEVITEIDMSFDTHIKMCRKKHNNFDSFISEVREMRYIIRPEFEEGFKHIYWD